MTRIRKTVLAATTAAIALGSMAFGSTAEAGFRFNLVLGNGYNNGLYLTNGPVSCWRPVWTGYGWVQQKFYGPACYH